MDRLPTLKRGVTALSLLGTLGALNACDDAKPPAASARRVVAVAAPSAETDLAHLCDAQPKQGALRFAWPSLSPDTPNPAKVQGWRWVNLWASWCKPCIEELPLIERTLKQLNPKTPLTFTPVSADADAEAFQKFQKRFPLLGPSVRISDATVVPQWATTVGLDSGATLPIHVFVDPEDNVRCARAGAVSPDDMALVQSLIR